MPLPVKSKIKLNEFADRAEGFALFGIFINPETGEMGTYSSHGIEPGAVLGFLQNSVNTMIAAAANNELEYIGGDDGQGTVRPNEVSQATGGKLGLVH